MILTQYFEVYLSSPRVNPEENVTQRNITDAISDGLTLMEEDGKIQELTFTMTEGYLWLDIISAGMIVELRGGTLERQEYLFAGVVKRVDPEFGAGDVTVRVIVSSNESKRLSTGLRNLIYPSKNHPMTWARGELLASEIILKLAEIAGYRRGKVQIRKDVTYTVKSPVAQANKSDWAFMTFLAEKINCVLWTEVRDGDDYINLVDEETQVNTISNLTFFYPSRFYKDGALSYINSGNAIQMDTVRVSLDTTEGKKGQMTTQVNPKTGETEVVTEQLNQSTGEWQKWTLDESKLQRLSPEERQNLVDLFMSGQLAWEDGPGGVTGVKQFFKLNVKEESSREPVSSVESATGTGGGQDGLATENTVTTDRKKYVTKVDENKLKNLSPEQRSQVMGRIARNEMTDADRQFYQVEEVKQPDSVAGAESTTPPAKGTQTAQAQIKRKRDAGFKIEVTCVGDLRITCRKSYILEGLSKYSGKYYLYRRHLTFGEGGFKMNLVFTK
jgi:hypothetical protein